MGSGRGNRGGAASASLCPPGPVATRGNEVVGDERGHPGRWNSGEGDDRGGGVGWPAGVGQPRWV